MITKLLSVTVVATLLMLFNTGIQRETARQQASTQEVLSKMCPLIWANIDKVRALPEHAEASRWCPEA